MTVNPIDKSSRVLLVSVQTPKTDTMTTIARGPSSWLVWKPSALRAQLSAQPLAVSAPLGNDQLFVEPLREARASDVAHHGFLDQDRFELLERDDIIHTLPYLGKYLREILLSAH